MSIVRTVKVLCWLKGVCWCILRSVWMGVWKPNGGWKDPVCCMHATWSIVRCRMQGRRSEMQLCSIEESATSCYGDTLDGR